MSLGPPRPRIIQPEHIKTMLQEMFDTLNYVHQVHVEGVEDKPDRFSSHRHLIANVIARKLSGDPTLKIIEDEHHPQRFGLPTLRLPSDYTIERGYTLEILETKMADTIPLLVDALRTEDGQLSKREISNYATALLYDCMVKKLWVEHNIGLSVSTHRQK